MSWWLQRLNLHGLEAICQRDHITSSQGFLCFSSLEGKGNTSGKEKTKYEE
jgi:hypothetical protein